MFSFALRMWAALGGAGGAVTTLGEAKVVPELLKAGCFSKLVPFAAAALTACPGGSASAAAAAAVAGGRPAGAGIGAEGDDASAILPGLAAAASAMTSEEFQGAKWKVMAAAAAESGGGPAAHAAACSGLKFALTARYLGGGGGGANGSAAEGGGGGGGDVSANRKALRGLLDYLDAAARRK